MLKVKSNTSAIVRIGRLLLFPSCLLTTLFVASIRFAPATTHAQTRQQDFGLPELHRIVSITLQPAYGCRSPQDLQKGYEKTALFVSVLPFSVKWQLSDCIEFINGNKIDNISLGCVTLYFIETNAK
jgi:hypothetical protein